MPFDQMLFLFWFLPLTLALYWICPKRGRTALLAAAGLIYCAQGMAAFLLAGGVLLSFGAGLLLERLRPKPAASGILLGGMALLFCLAGVLGLRNPVFPLGLPFCLLALLAYLWDIRRGKLRAERNFLRFGAGMLFFPNLIAGPLIPYRRLAAQLDGRTPDVRMFSDGIALFVKGLGKKLLLADPMAQTWQGVQAMGSLPLLTAWTGLLAYVFGLYYLWSGYQDMARGLALMLGIRLPAGFLHPYSARSLSGFVWRWNRTVTRWFRNYIYVPVSRGRVRGFYPAAGLLLAGGLYGAWQGTGWNMLAWGLLMGVFLLGERSLKGLGRVPAWLRRILALLAILFGWTLMQAGSLEEWIRFLRALCGQEGLADQQALYLLSSNLTTFFLCILGLGNTFSRVRRYAERRFPFVYESGKTLCVLAGLAVSLCYLVR